MRTILLLLLILVLATPDLIGCSFAQTSFCQNASEFEDELIVAGIISAVDNDGIDLDVISLIRGNETKTTIRIWDGTDFDCNGLHSMAATNIGSLNDTVVVMLPLIDTMQNTWDVIGDYRTPDFWTQSKILRVQNNVVRGFISGVPLSPNDNAVWDFDYDAFIDSWLEEMDCSLISSVDDNSESSINIFPNPTYDDLTISVDIESSYQICEVLGNIVAWGSLQRGENRVSMAQLPAGLYYVWLAEGRKVIKVIKAN